jgi:uncharacterized protein
MKLAGTHTFNAPRERVWAALLDIEALKRLIPGVESLEEIEPNTYRGVARIGVAGVKGEYTGTIRLSDITPPEQYTITGDGRGKPGHVRGTGTLRLTEDAPNRTTLHYTGDLQVGGPVAAVGQRLIRGATNMLVAQGLKALASHVEQQV